MLSEVARIALKTWAKFLLDTSTKKCESFIACMQQLVHTLCLLFSCAEVFVVHLMAEETSGGDGGAGGSNSTFEAFSDYTLKTFKV